MIVVDAARWAFKRIPAEVWIGLWLVTLLAGWTWLAYERGYDRAAAKAADRIAQLEAQVADLSDANAVAQSVITKLQDTNRELAEGRAADQEAAAEAVADLRSERDALQRELDRRRTDRGVIYERDPSAAAWAATRVPDAVARSLRE